MGRYKRKIKRESVKESPVGDESTLLRESAEQILHHEKLTGISRAMFDEKLHREAKNVKSKQKD